MKANYEYATAINWGKRKYECFDAFVKVTDTFTLCDGANSCESSGQLAKELARSFSEKASFLDAEIIDREHAISRIVMDIHETYTLKKNPGASTLLSLNILQDSYEIVNIGDSYGKVFMHKLDGGWEETFSIPRDIDYKGHPWQLIGSDVFELVHYHRFNRDHMACVFLMSDGVGDFIKNGDIIHLLNKNILEECDQNNLQDIIYARLNISEDRGSKDDKSICLVLIEKNE